MVNGHRIRLYVHSVACCIAGAMENVRLESGGPNIHLYSPSNGSNTHTIEKKKHEIINSRARKLHITERKRRAPTANRKILSFI